MIRAVIGLGAAVVDLNALLGGEVGQIPVRQDIFLHLVCHSRIIAQAAARCKQQKNP